VKYKHCDMLLEQLASRCTLRPVKEEGQLERCIKRSVTFPTSLYAVAFAGMYLQLLTRLFVICRIFLRSGVGLVTAPAASCA
jgi:hypothetical protein